MAAKQCSRCGETKPVADFYTKPGRKPGTRYIYAQCRACHYLLTEEWRKKNRVLVNERARDYNPAHRVGIPVAELRLIRPTLARACEVCGSTERIGIDHDHRTHLIRGTLCANCNFALGLMADDSERLMRLAEYVRAARTQAIS